MSATKDLLRHSGLILTDEDKEKCQTYQNQVAAQLSRFRVDYGTVSRVVETLLEAGRLMGAEQAIRRHEAHERAEEERVKAWTKRHAKCFNPKDVNN